MAVALNVLPFTMSMIMMIVIVLTAVHALAVQAWTWPDPRMEDLESARWDTDGWFPRVPVAAGLKPCTSWIRGDGHGRSNAADWVRTAFHDMATYNSATGTGGIDASIRWETSRPENVGNGFSLTFQFFRNSPGRYLSMADIISLALVGVVETCGGPELEWRGGRIDATAENDPLFTVPEPQGTLQSHIDAFARMDFDQTEMIGLVACGHTFGGVQKSAFPDLVPELNDPNNTESNAPFDTTRVNFDNNVATEYIGGTTTNPLVTNANDTFNSDKRIFGSDGNQTMAALANDPNLFRQTCGVLFNKMINIVPSGVQLTEIITPLTVKPRKVEVVHRGDGYLAFNGEVRLWNPAVNPARNMRVVVHHLNGTSIINTTHTSDMIGSAAGGRYRSEWFSWNIPGSQNVTAIPLTETTGAKGAHFEVQESPGGEWVVHDQQGLGFPIFDTAIFSETSCIIMRNLSIPYQGKYRVAVRRDDPPYRVFIVGSVGVVAGIPTFETIDLSPPGNSTPTTSPYDLWEAFLDNDHIFERWTLSIEQTSTSGHLDVGLERNPASDFTIQC
ncbi:putative L-ascorbate oxidase [Auriculariales sp. MPI-PUGE-AT-0066]|nr:putative L-ascorbate oxidase [Auriculariales sp. MPI-PUGE-AT-0066]